MTFYDAGQVTDLACSLKPADPTGQLCRLQWPWVDFSREVTVIGINPQ